jgi:thiamine pyrophosphokinase
VDDTTTAIVLAGGEPVAPGDRHGLPAAACVIAADSGLHQAGILGLDVDVVVGDFDSADPAEVDRAVAAGAATVRHPVAKDATDLDLALREARARGARRVIVLGGAGGRLDHLLGNALLLAAHSADLAVEWWTGGARTVAVRDRIDLSGRTGDTVSLLPIGGAAVGITTAGLRWSLTGETLTPGSTRGLSNELVAATASVTVDDGVLFVIHYRSTP